MFIIDLDKTISIHRLSAVSGNKTAFATLTTTIESTIQPLGDEKTAMYGGSFGKMFKIFCDVTKNIKEGDKVRDKDGNIYQIVAGGVEKRDDGNIADYLGLIVKKIN